MVSQAPGVLLLPLSSYSKTVSRALLIMLSDEEDYVMVQSSPISDSISTSSLSDQASPPRTPSPSHPPIYCMINTLDNSILAKIFLILASIHRPVVGYSGYSDMGFISASHVCHVWRTVMLACPELWVADVLTFPSDDAIQTILGRTQDLPLDFDLSSIHAQSASWCTTLCFNLLPRIRTLKLSAVPRAISHDDFNQLVRSIIAEGAPVLQSLDITQVSIRDADYFPDLEFIAPRLRLLRLHGVFFPCLSAALTFVYLKIGGPYLQLHRAGANVLDALRGSPETLEHILFDVVHHTPSPGQTILPGVFGEEIHLFNAKTVCFRGTDLEVMRPLQLPPAAFVYILLYVPVVQVVEEAHDVLIDRMVSLLLTGDSYALSLNAARDHTHLSIQSSPQGDEAWRIHAHTLTARAQKVARDLYDHTPSGSGIIPNSVEPGLLVEWHPPIADENRTGGELLYILLELVRHAISAVNSEDDLFQSIRCLDLCVADDLLTAEWMDMLKSYTAADTLRMHIESTSLLNALATQTSTLLPNLTTLILVLNNLDDVEDYREHQRVGSLVDTLESIVLGRLAAGRDISIEYVRLEGSSKSRLFAEAVRERLSVYVPQVDVALD